MIRRLETRYGMMYVPDTDIGQYSWLAETGASVEDEHICAVRGLLSERPRGTMLDIGASFGCWTLGLAAQCDTVLAFEPQHAVRTLLNRSLGENRITHVETLKLALGGAPGEITVTHLDLDRPANFGGVNLGIPLHDQPEAPMLPVPVKRLDDCGAQDVRFIKMDVEGMEAAVVTGGRETLERWRPLIFMETDHDRTDKIGLLEMVSALGYSIQQRGANALCLP